MSQRQLKVVSNLSCDCPAQIRARPSGKPARPRREGVPQGRLGDREIRMPSSTIPAPIFPSEAPRFSLTRAELTLDPIWRELFLASGETGTPLFPSRRKWVRRAGWPSFLKL